MPLQMLAWLLGAVAAGAVLLVLGLRGKRLNDHPVCGQCRFDLSGVPTPHVTCPECGAGLKRPGSIRSGQRRRRPIFIAVGAAAVALPIAGIGATGFALLTGRNVHQWTPLGVLLWEARYADGQRMQEIGAEVLKRYNGKGLDDDQRAACVARALQIQGERRFAWVQEWGDVIEAARSANALSDDDLHRFHRQAVGTLDWKVRPRVQIGDPIPVVLVVRSSRIGSSTRLMSDIRLKSAAIDGMPTPLATAKELHQIEQTAPLNHQLGWCWMFGKKSGFSEDQVGVAKSLLHCPSDLKPGRHTVTLSVTFQTRQQQAVQVAQAEDPPQDDPDVSEEVQQLSFVLLPEGEPSVELTTPDAAMKQKFERTLEPTGAQVYRQAQGGQTWDSGYCNFNVQGLPLGCAFEVLWRTPQHQWRVGSLTSGSSADPWSQWYPMPAGQQDTRSVNGSFYDFDGEKVEVVLRPSRDAAAWTVDVDRIYGSELIFKDVPVTIRDMNVYTQPGKKKKPNLMDDLQRVFGGK